MLLFGILIAVGSIPGWGQAPSSSSPESNARLGRTSLQFILSLMSEKDPGIRARAAAAWGEIGNKAGIPILRNALKDTDPYVRIAAAYGLHQLGDDSGEAELEKIAATPVAISSGTKKRNPAIEMRIIAQNKVRVEAILRMSEMGGESAVTVLEKTIEDPTGSIRDASAVALAKMGFNEFAGVFIEVLKSQDPVLRATAAKALGQIGNSTGVGALRAAAKDEAAAVRAEAVAALGQSPDSGILDVLAEALHDNDLMVRSSAVKSLERLREPEAAQMLYSVAEDTGIPALALKAMVSLSHRRSNVNLSLVERVFRQGDADLMIEAVEVLKTSRKESAGAILQATLDDPRLDKRVRLEAALALVKRFQDKRLRQ